MTIVAVGEAIDTRGEIAAWLLMCRGGGRPWPVVVSPEDAEDLHQLVARLVADAVAEETARLRGELGQHAYCVGPQKWGELFDEVHEEQDALRRKVEALREALTNVLDWADTVAFRSDKGISVCGTGRAALAPAPEET